MKIDISAANFEYSQIEAAIDTLQNFLAEGKSGIFPVKTLLATLGVTDFARFEGEINKRPNLAISPNGDSLALSNEGVVLQFPMPKGTVILGDSIQFVVKPLPNRFWILSVAGVKIKYGWLSKAVKGGSIGINREKRAVVSASVEI